MSARKLLKCLHCGWRWFPLPGNIPVHCPHCNSPHWRKPRMRKPKVKHD